MAASRSSRDARSILEDHIKKAYEHNAFPEAWRNLPEIPSSAEINPVYKDPLMLNEEPEKWNDYQRDAPYDEKLPHNIIDGPWKSKEDYLGAHYQIIREDSIASLRNSVTGVQRTPSMDETDETRIYTHVTVTGLYLTRLGVASRVEFSCERARKRIRWDQSKRLVQGTLVALTPERDMFKTICKIATVAARPIEGGLDQDPPTIDLFWGDVKDMIFDPVEKYVMVESRQGYFEASRHTMVAMQKMMTERFSFSKELVDLDSRVEAPDYVQQDPFMDLTSLGRSEDDQDGRPPLPSPDVSTLFNVDVLNGFPDEINGGMDDSQVLACRNMLTKRLAIVQGPPGTGKTFVSISALEVMIRSLGPADPPIIVAAQTNHALDQLLNHILAFEPQIVRLGGRSDRENVAIKKRTLYELNVANDTTTISHGLGFAAREHRALCEQVMGVLSPILNNSTFTADALLEHGIITEGQRRSLDAEDWAVEQSEDHVLTEDLAAWLTESQLMPIQGAPPVNLGFPLEEGDVEAEQLQALQQEAVDATGPQEKESEIGLAGTWLPLGRKFTGRHSGSTIDSTIKRKLSRCKDLFEIPLGERGRMYRYFEKQMNNIVMHKFQEVLVKYQRFVEDNYITKAGASHRECLFNIKLMRQLGIKVIGCTTTGLSKYRGLLSALEPRTLLIEEAAETLESKIIAGMMDSLQQLILVGDHKQLQASCTVQALQVAPFHLNVSMFERLVNNSMPFVMLNHQRRMIPDVRKLLCIQPKPFYNHLYDHASVLDRVNNRPPVPGMGGRDTYFFSHNWMESRTFEGSCYNLSEADMIVEFFNYLVLNGVEASKMTVLTFYNGQRKTIIKQLKAHPSLGGISYFNVFTVDSYQGEENDIILLSLVRSNQSLGVGFLDNKNRLVVALSRARRGLYLFGNSVTLTAGETTDLAEGREPLFDPLVLFMRSQGRYDIDGGLPITCTQHNSVTRVYDPDGWWTGLAGGCQRPCGGGILPCGHACTLLCHPFDHARIICREACIRRLPCAHGCSRTCGESCVCDLCQIAERPLIVDNFEYWDSDQVASSSSSQSPTKSAMKSAGSGSGSRRVKFNDAPNPYSASDVRRDLRLSNSRVSTSGRHVPSKAKTKTTGTARRVASDQASGRSSSHPSDAARSIPGLGHYGRSTGDESPPLWRGYGHEPVIDKTHPGFQNWAHYNAKEADQEIDQRQRAEADKAPKLDLSTLVIKDTYRAIRIKDGVRTVDPSGAVLKLIPRVQAESFAHLPTASAAIVTSGDDDAPGASELGQKEKKLSQKKTPNKSRGKINGEGSLTQKAGNSKQTRASPFQDPVPKPATQTAGFRSVAHGRSTNPAQEGVAGATVGAAHHRPQTLNGHGPFNVESHETFDGVPTAFDPDPWRGSPSGSGSRVAEPLLSREPFPRVTGQSSQLPNAQSTSKSFWSSKSSRTQPLQSMATVGEGALDSAGPMSEAIAGSNVTNYHAMRSGPVADFQQTGSASSLLAVRHVPLEPHKLWNKETVGVNGMKATGNMTLEEDRNSNGVTAVDRYPSSVDGETMGGGLDLLSDFGDGLPVRALPSHRNLMDETDDFVSLSSSAQNGFPDDSEDLIVF